MTKNNGMLIIAHRGASGYKTENTLESFQLAIDMGATMAELDIHVCASGELVVFHDFSLEKLTKLNRNIQELNFKELQHLELPQGLRIPSLEQVLGLAHNKINLNIELKGKGSAKACYQLLDKHQYKESWKKNALISSLDLSELGEFCELTDKYRVGLILDEKNLASQEKFLPHLFSIHYNKNIVGKNEVDYCRQHGLKLYAYTVNEEKDFQKLSQLGIDGVFTDYPDKFLNSQKG